MERKWLKSLRKSNNLTLEEVGKRLGVSKATVQRYESGMIDIPYNRICQLSDIYNVEPSYLFKDDLGNEAEIEIRKDKKESLTSKALQLYALYLSADPQIQNAVEILLKSSRQDS